MTRYMLDLAFSIVLLGVSIFLWGAAGKFPVFGAPSPVGADFWPRLIAAGIFVLSAVLIAQSVLSGRPARDTETDTAPQISIVRLVLSAILVIGYFLALGHIGFLISTIVFLGCAINLLPYGNRMVKLIFPIVFTVAMIAFFSYALSLPLPRGTGVFYDLNILFY
ncbi:MAG: tripartite tricarboxylate transporter TctB family protein [Qingshengfaniella sp.]